MSQASLENWSLRVSGEAQPEPTVVQQLALGLPGKPKDLAILAANDEVVVAARQDTFAVFARGLGEDEAFVRVATVSLPHDVRALAVTASDIWVAGARRLTHLRLSAGALSLVGRFELVRHEGDLFARRLADEDAWSETADDGADHHEGDSGDGDHDDERVGEIAGASLRGAIFALALEHDLVTLDVRQPSRLPTLGSEHFDEKLRAVATDGRFVYLRTAGDDHDDADDDGGGWRTFRATAASALDPAEHRPARAFAKKRQYAGRWAARLTGVTLQLARHAEAP